MSDSPKPDQNPGLPDLNPDFFRDVEPSTLGDIDQLVDAIIKASPWSTVTEDRQPLIDGTVEHSVTEKTDIPLEPHGAAHLYRTTDLNGEREGRSIVQIMFDGAKRRWMYFHVDGKPTAKMTVQDVSMNNAAVEKEIAKMPVLPDEFGGRHTNTNTVRIRKAQNTVWKRAIAAGVDGASQGKAEILLEDLGTIAERLTGLSSDSTTS